MADVFSKAKRSWVMSRIHGKHTTPERTLRSLLHRAGYRFSLHASALPGRPDIVLPKYRTAILVHGCFWHRHPGCCFATTPANNRAFWLAKFAGNVERDRRKATALRQLGWSVITVWECRLERDPAGVVRSVERRLASRRARQPVGSRKRANSPGRSPRS